MRRITVFLISTFIAMNTLGQADLEHDVFELGEDTLKIYFVGHGTLMLQYNDLVIHVDPVMREYDYAQMPDADLVLITHQHGDHLDAKALREIVSDRSVVIMTRVCMDQLGKNNFHGQVMANGDSRSELGIQIDAVPAYNIKHKRDNGVPYHPEGEGNGYILTLGETRILLAGDTENTPALKALQHIDIAFLPMNLPYTMTPEMVADVALAMKPKILYPYHYGTTNPHDLVTLLNENPEIEVRVRELQ